MQQQLSNININSSLRARVVGCVRSEQTREVLYELSLSTEFYECETLAELNEYLLNQSLLSLPEVLLLEVDEQGECFKLIEKLRANIMLKGLIIVLLSDTPNAAWRTRAMQLKVHDYYEAPYPVNDIYERLNFLIKFKLIRPSLKELANEEVIKTFKLPVGKRIFDIVFASAMLLALSPLLLLVALLIRLESKGPIIYKSKRVGAGFKIFDFYKFRSMYPDADKRLAELQALNQYTADGAPSTFVKFKNDPRITRIGRFIRKTSIDELPQILNILKGDMCVVGNRPLPFYEAEMLTSDEWTWRFLAPAGLTGLWQISRRGREEMSERERKKLDNFYAKKYCMKFDLKILLRTLPAALQKSDV
ncbi:MAG: sugar transferase [Sphingobacteriales bacterium]|nr:MAG: sugar transferase [Sphingobacteriales bacterium]